jgi:hypothetical protein
MIYEKGLLLKNNRTYKLSLSTFKYGINTETDENSLPFRYAKLTYNYNFKRGALQTGIGFELLTLPRTIGGVREMSFFTPITQVKQLWLFPYFYNLLNVKAHMLVMSVDNHMYYTELVTMDPYYIRIAPSNLVFTSESNALYYNINGEDVMLFTSATDGMFVFHPTIPSALEAEAPKIVSMCRHYERVFAIEDGKRNKLVFSANLDPTNWNFDLDEAGYIELIDDRGGLERVVSFNDYVYIFKEYGISRLSAYGDQSEFSLSSLFVSSGKIYGNSVCLCGDRIMFLSRDGIYSFNGYSATKISLNIESLFEEDNEKCCSAYHNGKYYLGCRLHYNDGENIGCESYADGYINNTLIELDLKSGDINIVRGVDLKSLCSIEYGAISKLLASFNNEHKAKVGQMTNDGKLFGTALKKVWVSPNTNLGYPDKIKKVRALSLISKYDCKVKIKTDKEEKSFDIKGSDTTSTIHPNVVGEMVQFSFESESADAYIAVPEITIGVGG